MTKAFLITSFCLMLTASTGCRPFCIGALGKDPKASITEANNYKTYRSANLKIVLERSSDNDLNIFDKDAIQLFGVNASSITNSLEYVMNTKYQAIYNSGKLTVLLDNIILLNISLPTVFHHHPIFIATGKVTGKDVFTFAARSRNSTGLMFVGIYSNSGSPIFYEVLESSQVRGVSIRPEYIEIHGNKESRKLYFLSE